MAAASTDLPRTSFRKRAGFCCAWVVPVVGLVGGALWGTLPVWGVFTDRLPVSVAWVVPFLQSTWPVGFALVAATGAVLARMFLPRRAAVGATVCAVLLGAATVLVPGVLGRAAERGPGDKDADVVRILSVNTWYHQASDAVLADTARGIDADIVVLPESSDAQAATVAASTGLELVQPVSTRTRGGGTALLVRPSWSVDGSVADLHLTRHQNPVVQLRRPAADSAGSDGALFTVMGVHTNAPSHADLVDGWSRDMRSLRDWASGADGPLVMIGDLNATTAHPELRRLGRGPGALEDCGGGLFAPPTWPRAGVSVPVPLLRLDHVLARGMVCAASGIVGVPGSDHAGVWADLRL